MLLKAVSDTIIIKLDYADKMHGLIVPDSAKQYHGEFVGIVESVGPACSFRNDLKKGERVKIVRHEGHKIICSQEEYFCVSERWVVGKEIKE